MISIQALDHAAGQDWALYLGDCVEVARQLPASSIDLALYSPPFSSLYTYSDHDRDMGNSDDDAQFLEHYAHLVEQLHRIVRPGRLVAVHCKDLVDYKGSAGKAGLRDFPGELIRVHKAAGFAWHSRITIRTCPVHEMQKTKAHGLLYKQLRTDSTFSRQGLAEYVLVFRRWPESEAEETEVVPVGHTRDSFPLEQWQRWADPVWDDVDHKRVLNVRIARTDRDERHMCLARGSLVLTYDGYKPIEDVSIGDRVLTHLGRWSRVASKVCNGRRPVVHLKAQGVPFLRLTPDHRVWTRLGRTEHPRKAALVASPTWVEAAATVSHWVNLPAPPEQDSKLTTDDWWVVGRWLGDGHTDTRGRLHISCADAELQELVERLGPKAGFVADTRTCKQVALKDPDGRFREIIGRCGSGAAGKVVPGEALGLPIKKARALLDGYLSADGHHTGNAWLASSVSRPLLLGMAIVAQRATGRVASVYAGRPRGTTTIQGRVVNTLQDWVFCLSDRNASPMLLEDGAWKKVRSAIEDGEAEVWDLEVEDDASFVAEGCVVHNCPLSLDVIERATVLWSLPGEVVFSPFAGIGSEGVGALGLGRKFVGVELKPEYFRVGVQNLRDASAQATLPLFAASGA